MRSVALERSGAVWFGTVGQGASRYDPTTGNWRSFTVAEGLVDDDVWSLAPEPSGAVWFGTDSGVSRYDPATDTWRSFTAADGLADGVVRSLALEPSGAVWFGTAGGGASRYDPATGTWRSFTTANGLANNVVRSLAPEPSGAVWFGTVGGGACRYDPATATWQTFTTADGLPDDDVLSLALEPSGAVWVGTDGGASRYDPATGEWESFTASDGLAEGVVRSLALEPSGAVWFGTVGGGASRYNPTTRAWQTFATADGLAHDNVWALAVGPSGEVWFGTDGGPSYLRPASGSRPTTLKPLTAFQPQLVLASMETEGLIVWRNRPTGMVYSTESEMGVLPADPAGALPSALAATPSGECWAAYVLGGLTLYSAGGEESRRFTSTLPDMNVHSVSQQPGSQASRAWVATDSGAALVDASGVQLVITEEDGSSVGVVDHVLALPDGGAYLAFNPVDGKLMPAGMETARSAAHFRRVSAKGHVSRRVPLDGVEILALANGGDGSSAWVATTAGLYRLDSSWVERLAEYGFTLSRITAGDTFPPGAVTHLAVDPQDPDGPVWCAIGGAVVGYDPDGDRIRVLTDADGLPAEPRIDALQATPDGEIVVMARGQIVRGRVPFPSAPLSLMTVLFASGALLLLSGGVYFGAQRLAAHRAERVRYDAVLDEAAAFFRLAGHRVERTDARTLQVQETGSGSHFPVQAALGDYLPVEEVQHVYRTLSAEADGPQRFGYVVYPKDLDPAATRQLDVYRLQHNTALIPLPVPLLQAKNREGERAVRSALSERKARYLGSPNLFDARNAIDETRFFFGRRGLIEELAGYLGRGEQVALVGTRKAGKTSLLFQLQQRLVSHPIALVDLQGCERSDPDWPQLVFAAVLSAYDRWGEATFGDRWEPPAVPDPCDAAAFRDAFNARRDGQLRLGDDAPLLVLLDEMERIFPREIGPNPEHAGRFVAFASCLRSLAQAAGGRGLALLVADWHARYNEVNRFPAEEADTNPFFRFFQPVYLPPLSADECTQMLTEIGHATGVGVAADVCRAVFADSGGHAALARQLASAAYELRDGAKELRLEHYRRGVERMREYENDLDVFFDENFWGGASEAERVVLARASAEGGATQKILEVPDGDCDAPALRHARRALLSTGLLEKTDDIFRVRGLLFRAWLAENKA